MPIEIREIVIRTTVGTNEAAQGPSGPTPKREEREELIQECVEQVMEVLKEKAER